jgi:hypothetical protein
MTPEKVCALTQTNANKKNNSLKNIAVSYVFRHSELSKLESY